MYTAFKACSNLALRSRDKIVISDVSTAHADCSDVSSDKYESSIASHLFEHPDCCAVYSDDCFRLCHMNAVLDC